MAGIVGSQGRLTTRLVAGLGLVSLSLAAPGPNAIAQTQPTNDAQLQSLIKELNAELQRGEDKRLIDPWFLRDLRQTISRYDNPWDTKIFDDKFSNRSSQPGPPWQVISGEMMVDWRYGLRSVVKPVAQTNENQKPAQENSIGQLFGALIKQATNDTRQSDQPTASTPVETHAAEALAPMAITNAFAIRLEVTSRPVDEVTTPRFEFGLYLGEEGSAGYRVSLLPGRTPSLELTSVSSRGTVSTLDIFDKALNLQDGDAHIIEWTRDPNGQMIVRVDGDQVLEAVDRRFTGPFDGFSIVNMAGDFALRHVHIDGTS